MIAYSFYALSDFNVEPKIQREIWNMNLDIYHLQNHSFNPLATYFPNGTYTP